MGIRCVPVVEIHLEDCRVPEDNLLGGQEGRGFKHAMITLDRARPGVAAQAVGLAQGALDLALEYTHERKQFGQSISSFQGVQWMLADMATQIEAARQLVHAAARAIDSGAKNITQALGHVQADGHRRGDEGHDRLRAALRRATATARTTPSRSTCATPRSPRSTRARTRSSAW